MHTAASHADVQANVQDNVLMQAGMWVLQSQPRAAARWATKGPSGCNVIQAEGDHNIVHVAMSYNIVHVAMNGPQHHPCYDDGSLTQRLRGTDPMASDPTDQFC